MELIPKFILTPFPKANLKMNILNLLNDSNSFDDCEKRWQYKATDSSAFHTNDSSSQEEREAANVLATLSSGLPFDFDSVPAKTKSVPSLKGARTKAAEQRPKCRRKRSVLSVLDKCQVTLGNHSRPPSTKPLRKDGSPVPSSRNFNVSDSDAYSGARKLLSSQSSGSSSSPRLSNSDTGLIQKPLAYDLRGKSLLRSGISPALPIAKPLNSIPLQVDSQKQPAHQLEIKTVNTKRRKNSYQVLLL